MTPERFQKIKNVLDKRQPDLTIVMDNVHKPHNLAAIIRSCDAIGIGHIHGISKNQDDFRSDYKFSNYAWGDDYHIVLKKQLYQLLNWIKKNNSTVKGVVCVDTSPVMDKVWAQRGGLGWIGKHTNLISRDLGCWFFLG